MKMDMILNYLSNIFSSPFFNIFGGISTIIIILSFFYTVFLIFRGLIPLWIRLGLGLSNRKIAVFAEADFENIKNDLIDSGLFREKNIIKISKKSLAKSEKHTIMLINYPEFEDRIMEILNFKKEADALIIFSPISHGKIKSEALKIIEESRNVILVNFRGRLLNDILVTMITTINEKR